jgi:iron complex outermembrane recepter protein
MRNVVAAAVACLSVAGLSMAADVQASIKKNIGIPAGGLGPALQILSEEQHIHFIFLSEDVDELRTGGASGSLTIEEALNQLLDGTGLTFRYIDRETVSIVPIAAASATRKQTVERSTDRRTRLRLAQTDAASPASGQAAAEVSAERSLRQARVEEVIVTAQKREERLQDVPISISVLSGDELDRSTAQGVGEMLSRVPGAVLDNNGGVGGGSQLAMRGVTAPSSYVSGSSPIGYYLDSVPFGLVRSSLVPDANIYDLDRVEVLRGPQGTLYGASAQAGVIRILTKDPDLDRLELKSRALLSHTEYGGENGQADLALNVPIIEGRLAARAVVGYQDLSGWIDKPDRADANDARQRNARLKLSAQPSENLSLGVSAWISRSENGSLPIASDGQGKFSAVVDVESLTADFDIYGVKVGYEFPAFSVNSATSYIDYANTNAFGQNPSGTRDFVTTLLSATTFAQELNFSSASVGPWRWTAGGIYRDGEDEQFQDIHAFAYPALVRYTSESWAIFGELTRELLDGRLELTVGWRYFEDTVGQQHEKNASNDPPPAGLAPDAEDKFTATTPRVILNWHPQDQMTLYVSYAEGFRSGLHQNPVIRRAVPSIPLAEPDTLKNYELGAKGNFLDGRIEYDFATYYMDWLDVQLPLGIEVEGIGRSVLVNGASASGMGVDFSVYTRPIGDLEIGANVSWNDLAVDQDVFTVLPNGSSALIFQKGDRLSGSIATTLGVSARYSFPIGRTGLEGIFVASANRRSKPSSGRSLTDATVVVRAGDPILMARAGFTVESPARWSATLFVDNLGNEQDIQYESPSVVPGVTNRTYPRPRTIGLQVEYRL